MAAKGKVLLLAIASLLVSTAAVASIPRSTALDPPPFDRYALDDRERDDNDALLAGALDRTMATSESIARLAETRVRGIAVLAPFERQPASELSRALRRASGFREFESASDATFCAGDPVNRRDPTGELSGVEAFVAGLLAGSTVSGGAAATSSIAASVIGSGGLGLAIGGAIITPFEIKAVREEDAAYEAQARLQQTITMNAARKRRAAQVPLLPGVTPYTQQMQGLPAAAQQLAQYHNQAVGATGPVTVYNARPSAKVARSVVKRINPARFNANARFGPAFYTSEEDEAALNEVAYHGGTATHLIRYDLQLGQARVLDLTDPAIAAAWGYAPSSSNYTISQGIAARARRSGYNVIKYKSLRGPGANYAVLDDFTTLLQAQGVFPVP